MARSSDQVVDPGRLYTWPNAVRGATGLGLPALYRLEAAGLEVRRLGRRRFVRGCDLVVAIWELAERVNREAGGCACRPKPSPSSDEAGKEPDDAA